MSCDGCTATEEWREHPRYPDLWISSHGHAMAEARTDRQRNRWGGSHDIRRPPRMPVVHRTTTGGYWAIVHRKKQLRLHVLMLEAFVGPRPKAGWHGCHNDDDPDHMCLKNLRWDTPQGNRDDCVARGTQGRMFGAANPLTTIPEDVVATIKSMTGRHRSIARQFGISDAQVSRIKRGLSRTVR